MAFAMFQKIAKETGFAIAEYMVGWCFDKGEGVEQNWTKAVEWYTKAAEKGLSAAMYNLGYCFENGRGVEQNVAKAVEWYTIAVDQGYTKSNSKLERARLKMHGFVSP
jgi:TPR repeat protein